MFATAKRFSTASTPFQHIAFELQIWSGIIVLCAVAVFIHLQRWQLHEPIAVRTVVDFQVIQNCVGMCLCVCVCVFMAYPLATDKNNRHHKHMNRTNRLEMLLCICLCWDDLVLERESVQVLRILGHVPSNERYITRTSRIGVCVCAKAQI